MRKNKQTKWQRLAALQIALEEDSFIGAITDNCKDFHCLTHAPNIGINAWIFTYHNVLVALWDEGNSHYSFFSHVSRFTLFKARFDCWIDSLRWRFTRG